MTDKLPKSKSKFSILKVGLLLTFLAVLYFSGLYVWKNLLHSGFRTEDAAAVHSMQENPKLKAEEIDSKKIYLINETCGTQNGMEVSIDKIQFRQDATLLWVTYQNDNELPIQVMPQMNTSLIDSRGNQYKVRPFDGNNVSTQVAPKSKITMMLVFEPVHAGVSTLNFRQDNVMDMKRPIWNYRLAFRIP